MDSSEPVWGRWIPVPFELKNERKSSRQLSEYPFKSFHAHSRVAKSFVGCMVLLNKPHG